MKKNLLIAVVFLFIAFAWCSANAVEVFQTETGLKQYTPEKAYNGYTLYAFGQGDTGIAFMIDMNGSVVRSWPNIDNPKLYEDGHIVGGYDGRFKEVDWDGNIVFQWKPPADRGNISTHHDMVRIYNTKLKEHTYLGVIRYTPTQEEALAAGCNPGRDYTATYSDGFVEKDLTTKRTILEIYDGKPVYKVPESALKKGKQGG